MSIFRPKKSMAVPLWIFFAKYKTIFLGQTKWAKSMIFLVQKKTKVDFACKNWELCPSNIKGFLGQNLNFWVSNFGTVFPTSILYISLNYLCSFNHEGFIFKMNAQTLESDYWLRSCERLILEDGFDQAKKCPWKIANITKNTHKIVFLTNGKW